MVVINNARLADIRLTDSYLALSALLLLAMSRCFTVIAHAQFSGLPICRTANGSLASICGCGRRLIYPLPCLSGFPPESGCLYHVQSGRIPDRPLDCTVYS